MTLKSLEEFNREHHAPAMAWNRPRPNGIACPMCGKEMQDTRPSMAYCTNPPRTDVGCECGFKGTRVV